MVARALAIALGLLGLVQPGPAQACRLALAMALDVSGSVDDREYRLQMSGLAEALGDPDVKAALFAMPDAPVAIAVYEWSSSRFQHLVQDWTLIATETDLDRLRARLSAWQRIPSPEATGLGAALQYGKGLLDRGPPCWSATLDVSGDGKNNDWPDPRRARASGSIDGIRINGLVIAPSSEGGQARHDEVAADLSAYFRARVIQGPDAFVEVAFGFEAYAEAMRRKLLRELKTQPIGQGPHPKSGDVVLVRGNIDQ